MNDSADTTPTYSIGAVARLTGLTTYTLRMWEHRYQAVVAAREPNGRRKYSPADVEKLALLKTLTDRGSPISSIAQLDLAALRERAEQDDSLQAPRSGEPVRVAVMGAAMPARLQSLADRDARVRLLASAPEPAQLAADLAGHAIEVLVLELPVLDQHSVALARSLDRQHAGRKTIVVYRFGRRQAVEELSGAGQSLLRSPVSDDELELALLSPPPQGRPQPGPPAQTGPLSAGDIPARRYHPQQLARLTKVETSIECECPRHLAEILSSLGAFEVYSQNCEEDNEQDAALHAYLHAATARARATMEEALHKLAEVEKFEL